MGAAWLIALRVIAVKLMASVSFWQRCLALASF